MHDNRGNYEPIIATRRVRESPGEDKPPLWRLILALGGGLAVVVLIAWWWMRSSSSDGASTATRSENSVPETRPEVRPNDQPDEQIEQTLAPPARDSETNADIGQPPSPPARVAEPAGGTEQAATPENIPEVAPDNAVQIPMPQAPVSVRFMSPDSQVRIELRSPLDRSPPLTSKAGDVVAVPPGTYRVVASGAQLETFEGKVTLDGERSVEYTVELCAERKHERKNFAGQVVEERTCAGAAQCESMFTVLSEHAEQLVKDRTFRAQQCAKWHPKAASEGKWTLDTKCDGATLATTCRIEIDEGACTFAEPRRSVRGAACPRAELTSRGN